MTEKKLKELLEKSAATAAFKSAVVDFLEGGEPELIKYTPHSPRIKVLRVLVKLLEKYPDEPISHVDVHGVSSCSRYYGTLTFGPSHTIIQFNWDCCWKAKQMGLKTYYGMPDQTKAAQMYDYQCFETFERMS